MKLTKEAAMRKFVMEHPDEAMKMMDQQADMIENLKREVREAKRINRRGLAEKLLVVHVGKFGLPLDADLLARRVIEQTDALAQAMSEPDVHEIVRNMRTGEESDD